MQQDLTNPATLKESYFSEEDILIDEFRYGKLILPKHFRIANKEEIYDVIKHRVPENLPILNYKPIELYLKEIFQNKLNKDKLSNLIDIFQMLVENCVVEFDGEKYKYVYCDDCKLHDDIETGFYKVGTYFYFQKINNDYRQLNTYCHLIIAPETYTQMMDCLINIESYEN